jgi:hypothetical protein
MRLSGWGWVAILFALPSMAQTVYKCDNGGRISYSQIPCAAHAARIDTRPAAGAYDAAEGARARLHAVESQARLRDVEARREAQRRDREERESERLRVELARQLEREQCGAESRSKMEVAERLAARSRQPEHIRRAKEEIEHWRGRLWWECQVMQ